MTGKNARAKKEASIGNMSSASSNLLSLLPEGTELLSHAGTVKLSKESKRIALYFSAHWCPPCRQFTPILADFYTKSIKENKSLEIIFVSSDKDAASFAEYFKSMPWKALPFEQREVKAKLASVFGIQGIPTLLVFDNEGNLVTADGRSAVVSGDFPFAK